MKRRNRVFSLLLALALLLSCLPQLPPVAEAATVDSGTCGANGNNLTWTLDDTGTLTISGTGAMKDYSSASDAPWYSQRASVKKVVIDEGVTTIGNYAFYGCRGLTSVEIPDSVTTIGNYAFNDCRSLTSVEIPDSVTTIGNSAFRECTSLTSVEIPDSVTTIGFSAFDGCRGLTSVEIPDSVTTIGDYAFQYCTGLTSVEIPDSVTTIGNYAFYDCTGLTGVEIGNSVTTIGNYAFRGCTSLTSVEIGNSVTTIGKSAFASCSSLTSVEIGNSVTTIGSSAFASCSSLTSVEIPDSVTTIGDDAFYGCSSLTSVEIPDSVTTIGDYAFYGCGSLTSVEIPDSVTTIGSSAFYGCSSLTSVEIPASVTTIGYAAFAYCESLTGVEIPASVTTIGNNAFAWCSDLTSVEIGDSVTTIGSYAFYDCTSLTGVEIPASVTTIGNNAFAWCRGLTSVEIGDSVTTIGDRAFEYCEKLTQIRFDGSAPTIGTDAFRSVTATAYYYPDESWTEAVVQNYGGTITWVALEKEEEAKVALEVSAEEVEIGETFTVEAVLTNSEAIRLGTVALDYDATALELIGGSCHVAGANPGVVLPAQKAGTFFLAEAAAVSGTVFTFQFKVKEGAAPGAYTIGGEAAIGLEQGEAIGLAGTKVTVGCEHDYATEVIPPQLGLQGYTIYLCTKCGHSYEGDHTDIIASGKCGTNVNWVLDIRGVLTVSGTGDMWDYTYADPAPWAGHSAMIKKAVVEQGVTSLGSRVFQDCGAMTELVIPASVTTIGGSVMSCADGLAELWFEGSAPAIEDNAFDGVTATAYYWPDASWTEDTLQNYGGTITWVSRQQSTASLLLQISKTQLKQGESFTVEAILTNTDPIKVGTVALSFDDALFELVGGTCHVQGANPAIVVPSLKAGTFLLAKEDALSGKLFTFELKVKDDAALGEQAIDVKASIGVSSGQYIPATGVELVVVCNHSYQETITPPTCTERGYTTYTCSCGDSYISDYTEPAQHDYQYTVTVEPTCTESGYVRYTCSLCDQKKDTVLPATGHSYGSDDVCENCGHSVAPGHSHSYSTVVTEPTCTASGYTTYSCSCGHSYRGNILEPTGHSWGVGVVVTPPSCLAEGEMRYTCTCGEEKIGILPAGHDWEETVTAPATCTEAGSMKRVCKACGETEEEILPAGHKWNEGTVLSAATCTEPGSKQVTCIVCAEPETQVIPVLGHHFYNGVCQRCGVGIVDVITPDPEHPLNGLFFQIDDIISDYGAETINQYGAYMDVNPGAKIQRIAVYVTQEGNLWRRTIACVGEDITYATFVPYLACDGEVKYSGLTSSSISNFSMTKNADGIWTYSNYATIGANLEDAQGNLLLSLYDIGQAGKDTRIFTDLEAMKNWLKNGDVTYGDASGDGVINSLDGLIIMRYLNGWNLNNVDLEAMDVNRDGMINSLDGLLIMRYLNGWNIQLG